MTTEINGEAEPAPKALSVSNQPGQIGLKSDDQIRFLVPFLCEYLVQVPWNFISLVISQRLTPANLIKIARGSCQDLPSSQWRSKVVYEEINIPKFKRYG